MYDGQAHTEIKQDKQGNHISYHTSHASITYREQLTPQRTVGAIGSVWQENTPSKETTGPAQTNTQSETAMKTNSRKWQTAHTRSDCCYHRLSVATSLRSYSYQRPLAEKTAG